MGTKKTNRPTHKAEIHVLKSRVPPTSTPSMEAKTCEAYAAAIDQIRDMPRGHTQLEVETLFQGKLAGMYPTHLRSIASLLRHRMHMEIIRKS